MSFRAALTVFALLLIKVVSGSPFYQLGTNTQAVLSKPRTESLPVRNATRSYWIDTPGANPLATEGSTGSITSDSDVCIIGSGITGVSAAYHLAKQLDEHMEAHAKQLKTVILDARYFCSGATGRNGGHLTPNTFLDFTNRHLKFGADETRRIYAIENYTVTELIDLIKAEKLEDAVDLVSGGHIAVYVSNQEVVRARTDFSNAKRSGLSLKDVEWLAKEEMQAIYGTSFPGSRYSGHNLWPLKLVTEIYKLAVRYNPAKLSISLHTNTPVLAVYPGQETMRRWKVSTPRGNISCSYVIHATNAYASHLLPQMHGTKGIIPVRGQVIALRANAPPSNITLASWGGNDRYWFPRPVQDGEEHPLTILGGGRDSVVPGHEYNITDDSVVRTDVGRILREFLPRMFPGKYEQGREPEMEWSGIMGYTELDAPFVGPVIDDSKSGSDLSTFDGQFIAAGYTGHGMPRAFACAEVVAGMVTAAITGKKWMHPDWLPLHYLTTLRDYRSPV